MNSKELSIRLDNSSSLKNLKYLSIGFVHLGPIAFVNLENLAYLNMYNCNFAQANNDDLFSHMPNLTVLINSNPIDSDHITYKNLTSNIEHLIVTNASKLDLSQELCQNLLVLSISSSANLTSSIGFVQDLLARFGKSSRLITLNLFSNNNMRGSFSAKCLSNLTNLRHISLADNSLEELDLNFEFVSQLETLVLNRNRFHSLDFVFSKLVNLKTLYLRNNHGLNQTLNANMFNGLVNLENLYLSAMIQKPQPVNELIPRDCFRSLRNLKRLDLQSNHLVQLHPETFAHTPSLSELNLANNNLKIDETSFSHLSYLKLLNLAGNRLNDLGENVFRKLEKLESLGLYQNDIHELKPKAFQGLNRLKHLCLNDNPLEDIQSCVFKCTENLELVLLASTQIPVPNLRRISEMCKIKVSY